MKISLGNRIEAATSSHAPCRAIVARMIAPNFANLPIGG